MFTELDIFINLSTGTKTISNVLFQKSVTVVLEDSYRRLAGSMVRVNLKHSNQQAIPS